MIGRGKCIRSRPELRPGEQQLWSSSFNIVPIYFFGFFLLVSLDDFNH